MSTTRQFLASTLFCALLPPCILSATPPSVEYVGGTVKTIPANTVGTLNLDDARQLRFIYNGSVFALPYEQITTTDIAKGEGHHILRKIPVPSLNPGKRKDTLTIAYKDPSGATGTLNFLLTATQASDASDEIAIKKVSPAVILTANQNEEWWGDKYWKTNRNKGAWSSGNAQATQATQPGQTTDPGQAAQTPAVSTK
jgi:hypothetical protein